MVFYLIKKIVVLIVVLLPVYLPSKTYGVPINEATDHKWTRGFVVLFKRATGNFLSKSLNLIIEINF